MSRRLEELFRRGRYECPREPCGGAMVRRSPWTHDELRTGFATFACTRCRYREELVVSHYTEEEELALHRQQPTYSGRARCPRCEEPMEARPLGGRRPGVLRFACPRCGGARDVLLGEGRGHRAAGRPGSVVVADPDRRRAGELAAALDAEGKEVVVAVDEEEALRLLEAAPRDALLVADDGSLNADLLLSRTPALPRPPRIVVLLTPDAAVGDGELPGNAVRLPLPVDPALLSWFVAYASEPAAGGEPGPAPAG